MSICLFILIRVKVYTERKEVRKFSWVQFTYIVLVYKMLKLLKKKIENKSTEWKIAIGYRMDEYKTGDSYIIFITRGKHELNGLCV